MISALITLIVYILILGLLWFLLDYVLTAFPPPEPAGRLIRVVAVVIFVLVAIFLLLGVFGIGGVDGVPRFRFG
jgi:hypothetical protein